MRITRRLAVVLLGFISLLGGCPRDDASGDDASGGVEGKSAQRAVEAVTNAEVSAEAAAYIDTMCGRMIECDGDAPQFSDKEGCYLALTTLLGCTGKLKDVHLAGMDTCMHDLEQFSCDELVKGKLPKDCGTPWRGSLGAGDACGGTEDPECGRGLSCQYGSAACGVCVKNAKLGESCEELDCEDGTQCSDDEYVCGALKKDGASCSTSFECLSEVCRAGKCAHPKLGDACNPGSEEAECADNLNCVEGKCAPLVRIGEPCAPGLSCVADAVCAKHVCEQLAACGEGAKGDACIGIGFGGQCVDGLACPSPFGDAESVCMPPHGEGERCDDTGNCAEGLSCTYGDDGDEPTCLKDEPSTSESEVAHCGKT